MQQAAVLSNLPIPTSDQVHHVIGISLVKAISIVFDIDEQHALKVSEHYKATFLRSDQIPCELFDGAHETLSSLSKLYTLGVATGKARRGLIRAFESSKSAGYFDKTRCADDNAVESKPHPSMLLQLLDEWQIAPENAVMIGDTVYDMQMAEVIGMPRIAVSYGVHSVEKLAAHKPLAIIDTLPELLAHLSK